MFCLFSDKLIKIIFYGLNFLKKFSTSKNKPKIHTYYTYTYSMFKIMTIITFHYTKLNQKLQEEKHFYDFN